MANTPDPTLIWFRQDLRVEDNPALIAASSFEVPILAIYVLDNETPAPWAIGGAARWWLHHSLKSLAATLKTYGIALILRRGRAETIIPQVARQISAGAVYWNRCYEPFAIAHDTAIKAGLRDFGIEAQSFSASLLSEPWTIKTQSGTPFRVFTPYWRALSKDVRIPRPLKAPSINQKPQPAAGDRLEDWNLLPTHPNWAERFSDNWTPGEAGAQNQLKLYIEDALVDYPETRNLPGVNGVSRLSPYLHWGEISIRQVWNAIALHAGAGADAYLRELAWRDFAHHLLWQFPELPQKPFAERFSAFPWRTDAKALRAWQQGRTGYPIVDAEMKQLWATGWMHNRVRMVVASFLVKHLLISWRAGEDWFWDCLVDADLANNAMNWQWVAGSGAARRLITESSIRCCKAKNSTKTVAMSDYGCLRSQLCLIHGFTNLGWLPPIFCLGQIFAWATTTPNPSSITRRPDHALNPPWKISYADTGGTKLSPFPAWYSP